MEMHRLSQQLIKDKRSILAQLHAKLFSVQSILMYADNIAHPSDTAAVAFDVQGPQISHARPQLKMSKILLDKIIENRLRLENTERKNKEIQERLGIFEDTDEPSMHHTSATFVMKKLFPAGGGCGNDSEYSPLDSSSFTSAGDSMQDLSLEDSAADPLTLLDDTSRSIFTEIQAWKLEKNRFEEEIRRLQHELAHKARRLGPK